MLDVRVDCEMYDPVEGDALRLEVASPQSRESDSAADEFELKMHLRNCLFTILSYTR